MTISLIPMFLCSFDEKKQKTKAKKKNKKQKKKKYTCSGPSAFKIKE